MEQHIKQLRDRREQAAGSARDTEAQHAKRRLTARERIDVLFDPGTFTDIDTLVLPRYESYLGRKASRLGDEVITGFGMIARAARLRRRAGCRGDGRLAG